jgi:hypothetical protein
VATRLERSHPGREGSKFEEGKPRAGRMRKRDSHNPIPWAIGRAVRATRLGREGENGNEEEDEQLEGGGDTVGEEVLEAGEDLARDLDGRDAHAAREGCIRRGEGKCRASVRRSKVKCGKEWGTHTIERAYSRVSEAIRILRGGGRRTRERERREREGEREGERERRESEKGERERERERESNQPPEQPASGAKRERDIT